MSSGTRNGFTLVETMAAALAASVLAVTVSAVLFFSYRGWVNMQAAAELQRDGTLAMQTLSRAIRGGTSNMQWTAGSSELKIYRYATNTTVVAWTFAKTGARLVSTPAGRPSADLVRTGVTAFACVCTPSANLVTVALSLTEPTTGVTMNMTNVNVVARRR